MITDSHVILTYLDPGSDLGSAQSQNWCLDKIKPDENDYIVNLDPDSACPRWDWITAMERVLDENPLCVVISCYSPLVKRFIEERKPRITETKLSSHDAIIAEDPIPFNISMWRYSFIKEINGIPQMGAKWGETEGPTHAMARERGKYHAYLKNFIENESGKFMQDKQLLEYKDRYMRTVGPQQFVGFYNEFLELNYPDLLKIDTKIPDGTVFQ